MKKTNALRTILIIVLFSVTACKKLIEIPTPKTEISSTNVFSDIETANAAVLGLYSQMMSSELDMENGGLSIYSGLLADDLLSAETNRQFDPFQHNAITADNTSLGSGFWSVTYTNIYQANSIIEGLQNAVNLTGDQKNALIGEARLVRSFYYFYLCNLFGPVPLVTSKDFQVNALLPRASVDSIYSFIITDLSEAEKQLPESYLSSDRSRPGKWVAAALLSRVYLFMENWESTIQESTKVINSPDLSLAASGDISNAFLSTSQETIWQLPQAFPNEVNTVEGEIFIPSTGSVPQFIIRESLLNSFEPGDLRRTNWIDSIIVDGTLYYYPAKYKIQSSPDIVENDIIFRLPEQYLLRAEAYMKLNRIDESVQDLNKIRERAGLPDAALNVSQQDLENLIASENRHEYFAEFGHRWLDLKRTNMVNSVLSAEKGADWQDFDSLLPLPLKEIEKNKNLTQNPGY